MERTSTILLLLFVIVLVCFQFFPNMGQFSIVTTDWWSETTAVTSTTKVVADDADDDATIKEEVTSKDSASKDNVAPDSNNQATEQKEQMVNNKKKKKNNEFVYYHEWVQQDPAKNSHIDGEVQTSYNRAKVLWKGGSTVPSFRPHRICRETCCVETILISIDQDDTYLMNTVSGLDLADTRIAHYETYNKLRFHASPDRFLTPDVVPCLQPGTIIQLDNHLKIHHYFFEMLRPNITVPFVLITSESDGDSPSKAVPKDDLILKWYGMNPSMENVGPENNKLEPKKFEPFPLGLSKQHPQAVYLERYLRDGTNFTNPFREKTRFQNLNFDDDDDLFFVSFTMDDGQRKHRKAVFDEFCSDNDNASTNNSTNNISCRRNIKYTMHEFYSSASHYKFGLSPPGVGWDCYRTYEFLVLGMIPIIQDRPGVTLYDELPVIRVENNFETLTKADLKQKVRDYVTSDAFLQNDFQEGWERLFLKYWRRKVLTDAQRTGGIHKGTDGDTYYEAFKYTPNEKAVYCSHEGECES